MTGVNSLSLSALSKKVQVKETILILSIAIVFPFLIHMIPSVGNVPMGAILLPAFVAPFIANYFYKMHVGLFTAIVAPTLNYILTGSPKFDVLSIYSAELVVFTAISFLLLKQNQIKIISAPLAYIFTKILLSSISMIFAVKIYTGINPLQSFITAIPGIFLLAILNFALVKINKK